MAIAATVKAFLERSGITYAVVPHPLTETSYASARAAQVPADKVAKAVVLKDGPRYLLAILPASRMLDIHYLRSQTGVDYQMANEEELDRLFPDCARGAVPAIGRAYGMDAIPCRRC